MFLVRASGRAGPGGPTIYSFAKFGLVIHFNWSRIPSRVQVAFREGSESGIEFFKPIKFKALTTRALRARGPGRASCFRKWAGPGRAQKSRPVSTSRKRMERLLRYTTTNTSRKIRYGNSGKKRQYATRRCVEREWERGDMRGKIVVPQDERDAFTGDIFLY